MYDGCFVQVREFRHIVRLVELRWVNLVNVLGIDFSLLKDTISLALIYLDVYTRVLTSPSSHWTSNVPSSPSCKTSPLTKAFSGSLSQTYLFPEKSLSPSSPRIWSAPRFNSSDLINSGAKVLEDWLLFLVELERLLTSETPFAAGIGGEKDEFRVWDMPLSYRGGDVNWTDFGLAVPAVGGLWGTGEGE